MAKLIYLAITSLDGCTEDAHGSFAALWQAAEKVVSSTTLDGPTTGRTRLERTFEPEAVPAQAPNCTDPV